ncbi:MAG TPA: ribosome maturation factor RimM [Candidatus Acidoferrales bacterium]|nr:ribosome maturation factor RimM [Candidatus Acidoferrales bacterium]
MADQKHATWLTLARILRPHGRRGEVAAEILTDFPERLRNLKEVHLSAGGPNPRKVAVRSCWLSQSRGGQAIFHFQGSDSISDAERLRGVEIQVPLADRMPLGAGRYYVTDLIGCEVRTKAGEPLGRVCDVQTTGEAPAGTPLLAVDSPRGEWLLPLADAICVKIDVAGRQIEVALPEGLLALYWDS